MAEVFLAEFSGPQGFKRQVALKLILPEQAVREEVVRMFLDEARVAAQFTHPNIIQVYDFGEEDGRYFMAMEYARGLTLRKLLRKLRQTNRSVPSVIAASIGSQSCAALAYAHAMTTSDGRPMEVVHRDISPDNIYLTVEGFAKVLDFGIAKAADRTEQTQLGMLKGKPSYMSPEQVAGKKLDGRSDVFAMGCTLWEALAMEKLYDADDVVAVINKIANEPARPLRSVATRCDPALETIIMGALERNVERRPDADALKRTLDSYLHASGLTNHQEAISQFLKGKSTLPSIPVAAVPTSPAIPSSEVQTPTRIVTSSPTVSNPVWAAPGPDRLDANMASHHEIAFAEPSEQVESLELADPLLQLDGDERQAFRLDFPVPLDPLLYRGWEGKKKTRSSVPSFHQRRPLLFGGLMLIGAVSVLALALLLLSPDGSLGTRVDWFLSMLKKGVR
jgi:serine/threonine-protein kinase